MDTTESDFIITPETKIGALLDKFPQLEEILLELAPAFKKLRNPMLRKTVAKVTTLRQVAQIGDVPLTTLINRLRSAASMDTSLELTEEKASDMVTPPNWFDQSKIAQTLDARPMITKGEQPITRVLTDLKNLTQDQIYELITPFLPVPLIDKAKNYGFRAWTKRQDDETFRTYFAL